MASKTLLTKPAATTKKRAASKTSQKLVANTAKAMAADM